MTIEGVIVAMVILGAVGFVVRKAFASAKGEKGSCRSCGDVCGCSLKEAIEKSKRSQ